MWATYYLLLSCSVSGLQHFAHEPNLDYDFPPRPTTKGRTDMQHIWVVESYIASPRTSHIYFQTSPPLCIHSKSPFNTQRFLLTEAVRAAHSGVLQLGTTCYGQRPVAGSKSLRIIRLTSSTPADRRIDRRSLDYGGSRWLILLS